MMITKQDVLSGIRTCSELEHIWYNRKTPNHTFQHNVVRMRKVLEQLLDLKLPDQGE